MGSLAQQKRNKALHLLGLGGILLLLSGCTFSVTAPSSSTTTSSQKTTSPTQPTTVGDPMDTPPTPIRVGDCFSTSEKGKVYGIPIVPCSGPHDYETYLTFDMPDGPYPEEAGIKAAALEGCTFAFESFVGISVQKTTLDYTYFGPLEEGWNKFRDRQLSCVVFDPAGETVGTLKGAAR